MTSNQKTVKHKFNAIDAFIIVIVILCVLGIYFRSQISSWLGFEKDIKEYKMVFVIDKIKYTSSNYLSSGTEVYMNNGVALGILGECSSLPAVEYLSDENGDLVEVNYPQDTYVDVEGFIKCKGVEKEDGFYIGGTYSVAPGTELSVHTEMIDFVFTIVEIVEIED